MVELIPELMTRTSRGAQARLDAFGRELGIEGFAVGALNVGYQVEEDGHVTPERVGFRFPYSLRARVPEAWRMLVGAGLAEEVPGGWRITARGRSVVERLNGEARAAAVAVAVPAEPARRSVATLEALASRIPPDSPRAGFVRRIRLLPGEKASDLVRIRRALAQLWARRDDCHIGAWEDAGYQGPALDVLSQVWEGRTTVDEVAKALEAKQERKDVERDLEALVRRGDVARDGATLRLTPGGKAARDAIEAETDRRYFVGWPEGAELARLGDDLTALLNALPA